MQEALVPWILPTPLGGIPGLSPGPQFRARRLIFTAGIVLAFMVLPFITAVSRDVLRMVPRVTKEAGYGMGSTTLEVMRKISLRFANSGIAGAVFIGLGRALGETMAVAFIIGGLSPTCRGRIFDPGTSIASLIAQQFSEATDELQVSALVELGLILFVITMVFQVLAQVVAPRARSAVTGGGHEHRRSEPRGTAAAAPSTARRRVTDRGVKGFAWIGASFGIFIMAFIVWEVIVRGAQVWSVGVLHASRRRRTSRPPAADSRTPSSARSSSPRWRRSSAIP